MAKKVWTLNLDDGTHIVELDHAYFSGRKEIRVDGQSVPLSATAESFVEFGGDYPLAVGEHQAVIHIRTNGITFRYDLSVDGKSIETGLAPDSGGVSRQRRFGRSFMCCWIIGAGVLFFLFFQEWELRGIPLPYVGIFLVAFGILGLVGVNIFRGGPLDKRHDR